MSMDELMSFYKELADLLHKYRGISNKFDFRRTDENWIELRVPYSFMVCDDDFAYDHYLYRCNSCGVKHYTNDKKEEDEICDICHKGVYQKIDIKDHQDWVNYPK